MQERGATCEGRGTSGVEKDALLGNKSGLVFSLWVVRVGVVIAGPAEWATCAGSFYGINRGK